MAIPVAKSNLSEITTGIKEFQTAGGKLKTQIQAAPPTEWAVKVAPKLFIHKLDLNL